MHAVRNISLCTKDCLCLYVCPTGATDTETGQIDASKCLDGCRLCVDACPSHAITLIPEIYPAQQEKTESVKKALLSITESKVKQEAIAASIESNTDNPILRQFAKALRLSNRIMAEDFMRESGYMLPQSQNTQDFLQSLLDQKRPEGFPVEVVEKLLVILKNNNSNKMEEKKMENKTLDNLMEAFAGESQANRKYLAYSKKAEKDGKLNAAKLFKAASDAETIHALKHFEVAGKVHTTAENLKDGIAGETHEYKEMYPDFVKLAQEEGNKAAVMTFTYAMKAEEVHARLYQEALENIDQTEEVFYYLCPVCGNIEKFIPEKCSICNVSGDKFIKY
jgi:rubrerythrin/NAD-dependent dihydropyrimidine dehydrogenase PreA subunit